MIRVGYARVSTRLTQDPIHQRRELLSLGVEESRIYTDHGFTGANRNRPGLDQALAALQAGDVLVITKLDRLGRSVRDLHDLADIIRERGAKLQIGSSVHDPQDPFGALFFTILAAFSQFELDLIRARTREGMETARLKGRLRGRPPKLSAAREREMVKMVRADEMTVGQIAEIFGVGRATVYRAVERAGGKAAA